MRIGFRERGWMKLINGLSGNIYYHMMQPIHFLNKFGVMTSFSIAKKITEEDINNFFVKNRKSGKTDKEIGKLLQASILDDIQKAIKQNKIPGVVGAEELAKDLGMSKEFIQNMPELNRLISLISGKLIEKKYDKMSLCYFINHLVSFLNLTEKDFQNFHKKNKENDPDEDDEDDGNEVY